MSDLTPVNETQVSGLSIASMANIIKSHLNDFLSTNYGGIAVVAASENEISLPGFNNCNGPRAKLYFVGEAPYGDESTSDVTGVVIRDFELVIERAKLMTAVRNTALTTNYAATGNFYDQVEGIRDVIRGTVLPTPMVQNPPILRAVRAHPVSDKQLVDAFTISFSIICQIGRITYTPAAIDSYPQTDFVQYGDGGPIPNNAF